jgi:glycosyltransferase involved in cell wall biosynthesis
MITVILCTFNRCHSLKHTLDSVARSVIPGSIEWEVLVVDNNSTDQTQKVVNEFSDRHSNRFRYLFEPTPGKSHALNAGIRESRGDVLVFMDDDVTVDPTWLHNLTAGLCDGKSVGVGGRTLPAQAFSSPRWLSFKEPYNSGGIVAALFDLGDEPSKLERPPYGANMAFSKIVFEKYGGFRTDLGPGPGSEIRSEDTEFGRRLIAAGEQLRYEPSAVVFHPILENRVRKDYFLSWWFDYGRADVREWKREPNVWGIPRPYLRILKAAITCTVPKMLQWMFALNPVRRFYCRCQVWRTVGWIAELYRQSVDATATNQHGTIREQSVRPKI